MQRKIAVVTTFSLQGFHQYAERMLETWARHWPAEVDLYVYPDEKVAVPRRDNIRVVTDEIKPKAAFIRQYRNRPKFNGVIAPGAPYNYRYDAVKFCHKPFALWHAMTTYLKPEGYSGLIWLDADTITHTPVDTAVVKRMAPPDFDIQFLGRCYKYTECGYLYFNLERALGVQLLEDWVALYTSGALEKEREWHDSYLYDVARKRLDGQIKGNDLTGHIPRRHGAGHPLINSFLGGYLDHLKGEGRKVTGKPRKGDLFADHQNQYWKDNPHAKARHKPRAR